MNLHAFYQAKLVRHDPLGFVVEPHDTHERLFPWQRELVIRALRLGRSALFANTGLGKTLVSLEWAYHVATHEDKPVLIVCPLAVAHQFQDEAHHLGLKVPYIRHQEQVSRDSLGIGSPLVYVTNYDALSRKGVWNFEPQRWAGVVLDEAAILRNFTGTTRQLLNAMWRDTPYRLAQTATPSPNDLTEILNIAEWLGIMESGQALTRWFLRDSQNAGNLRLKGHARSDFYRWLASWATALTRPSDLGDYDDTGYLLPPLTITPHLVEIDYARFQAEGQLVPSGKRSSTEMWADKRETAKERVKLAVDLATSVDRPVVVWVATDAESTAVAQAISGSVEVHGRLRTEEKESRLRGFAQGYYRVMVTKPKIASLGLNWQNCADMVFASIDFSFEARYQAIRRCYRFGQQRPVNVHIISTETEANIQDAIGRKERQHCELIAEIVAAQRAQGLHADHSTLGLEDYHPTVPLVLPEWLRRAA